MAAPPLIQIRVPEHTHIPLALSRTLGPMGTDKQERITGETQNAQTQAKITQTEVNKAVTGTTVQETQTQIVTLPPL